MCDFIISHHNLKFYNFPIITYNFTIFPSLLVSLLFFNHSSKYYNFSIINCFDTFSIVTCYFSLWETSQTLLVWIISIEITRMKEFTRFWGLIMFGSFRLINIIVLLNLLIAMMNHSYQLISVTNFTNNVQWTFHTKIMLLKWLNTD